MSQLCHHTTENWGNKTDLKFPVYGTSKENYFGNGYYFWDNNRPHANWFGRMQYKGNYYVFETILEIDKNQMFDTTDRNDIQFLKESLTKLIDNEVDLKDFYLGSVLSMFFEEEKKTGKVFFPFKYAKGIDDNRNSDFFAEFNPKMTFSIKAKSSFYLNPVVFFCIFDKESVVLRSFDLVDEKGVSVK